MWNGKTVIFTSWKLLLLLSKVGLLTTQTKYLPGNKWCQLGQLWTYGGPVPVAVFIKQGLEAKQFMNY